jgi:glycosyltransferase involved in cell wall biosynthesis
LQVFLNGRFATQALTGVQRYAEEMVCALDRELRRVAKVPATFTLLIPRTVRRLPVFDHIAVRQVGRLRGHAWEQLELPWYARGGFLVSLANTGPLMKGAQIITMHDASAFAVPETYSLPFRLWYRLLLPALGRAATRVVTDSEFSRSELRRYAGVPDQKLRVIPLSGEHILHAQADCGVLARLQLRPRSYVLTVGSQSPHKNLQVVLDAMQYLDQRRFEIVVAGGQNPKIFGNNRVAVGPEVKLAGYVSDGELRALYENAGCFVYPSLYEGFGLPPLEAMMCGCPVIVSRKASLPEVCGSAAVYCDPGSPRDVAESIERVMLDSDLQDHLRTLSRHRAQQFSWDASARALLGLVQEVGSS